MVASLTPWRLATSATLSLSASRRIRTICSSLYRFFFMCFSRSKKPLSPNYGGSKKPGQVTPYHLGFSLTDDFQEIVEGLSTDPSMRDFFKHLRFIELGEYATVDMPGK